MFAQSFTVGRRGVAASSADWARLAGLPLGGRRASSLRRVGSASAALVQEGWIVKGRGGLLTLMDRPSKQPYASEPEASKVRRLREREAFIADKSESQARYHPRHWEGAPLAVPAELWANGWIGGLSAKAVIAYMIILNHRDEEQLSVVPKIRTHQYDFGPELWSAAVQQLVANKLIGRSDFATRGIVTVHAYRVRPETLQRAAPASLWK